MLFCSSSIRQKNVVAHLKHNLEQKLHQLKKKDGQI